MTRDYNFTTSNYETPPLQQPANPLRRSGDYATTTAIPLDGELAVTAQTLLSWLQAQLTEGEVSRPSVP
jgi:hypothetical protein